MERERKKIKTRSMEISRPPAVSCRTRKFFFRAVSSLLIFVFVWSQVLPADTASAFQEIATGFLKAPAYERIVFPDFARVEWANAAVQVPRGVVYLFQDAHTSLLAQKRITQTLLELRKQGAIDAVLVEGAAGPLTAERFDVRPELERSPELIEALEKQGDLHGAAAFYLLRPDTTVEGLESAGLYRENRQAFREVFGFRSRIDPVTERFKVEWQRWLKDHVDEEARIFFLNSASRHTDSIDPAYFQQLLRMASDKAGISWSIDDQAEWPQLIRVQRMLEIQSRLRMNEARTAFQELKKVLPASFGEQLDFIQNRMEGNLKGTAVQEDASLYRDFAAQMMAEFAKKKQPVLPYRAFYDWLACETFRQEIQAEDLSLEIERLEDRIWKSQFPNPEDRGWMALGRLGVLLAKASRLELSRGEARQFSKALKTGAFGAWIAKFFPEEKEAFAKFGNEVLGFYKLAEEREQGFGARLSAMLEALSVRKKGMMPQVAVVTGGYHKSGLLENLKSQGLRVAVVTPVLEQVDQNVAYLGRMLEATPAASTLSMVPSAVVGRSELRELLGAADAERSESRLTKILGEVPSAVPSVSSARKPAAAPKARSLFAGFMGFLTVFFPSLGWSQSAGKEDPYKERLQKLNQIAKQGFGVKPSSTEEKPFEFLGSGRLNAQNFVWGKGLGAGGSSLEKLMILNPQSRMKAIEALLQNELRSRYISLGLDIKTGNSSTKLLDLYQPSPMGLIFLKLRAATEALEYIVSSAPENAAAARYAEGLRLEWEAQVRLLEGQAYATVTQVQKANAQIEFNTRVLNLLKTSLPQTLAREKSQMQLEKPGTALNVELRLRTLDVETRSLIRQRQTLLAELGFLFGVSPEAISPDSVSRLAVPLVPVSWGKTQRENFSNRVLGAVSESFILRSGELKEQGAHEAATAEQLRGWFHIPIRISGLSAEQAGGKPVPGGTPERRRANLEEANQQAASEAAQAKVSMQARTGLDKIWEDLDKIAAWESMLGQLQARWQSDSFLYHSGSPRQMNLMREIERFASELIAARARVSETLAGLVGLDVLSASQLQGASGWISPALYLYAVPPRSEARTWIRTFLNYIPLLLMAGYAFFLTSCATGPGKMPKDIKAPMEWTAPHRHIKSQRYTEPPALLPVIDKKGSDAFYGDLLPPKASPDEKAKILASTPLAESPTRANQSHTEVKVDGTGKTSWDASQADAPSQPAPEKQVAAKTVPANPEPAAAKTVPNNPAPEKPATAPKRSTVENEQLIKTLLDSAKKLSAYHLKIGAQDSMLDGKTPIMEFQKAVVAAADSLTKAGLKGFENPLGGTNVRGNYGRFTDKALKNVIHSASEIQTLLAGAPAQTKTAQAPAPKAGDHPSKRKTAETEAQRDEAINKAVAGAASRSSASEKTKIGTTPEALKNPPAPAKLPVENEARAGSAQEPSPAAKTSADATPDKKTGEEAPIGERDLSAMPDKDFIFTSEITTTSAPLGDGKTGGFVLKAFSAATVEMTKVGESQTLTLADSTRANTLNDLFDSLDISVGQLGGMEPAAWTLYEKLPIELGSAMQRLKLSKALRDREELEKLETYGDWLEIGNAYVSDGRGVNAGDDVVEVFSGKVVGVDMTVPLKFLRGTELDVQINDQPAKISGRIRVVNIDWQNGPVARIHFAALPSQNILPQEKFRVKLRVAKAQRPLIQAGEPVEVRLGQYGGWRPARRFAANVSAPEDGFFRLFPGYHGKGAPLAARHDGEPVLTAENWTESWQDLLQNSRNFVDKAADMLARNKRGEFVGEPEKLAALQKDANELSQILTGIGQSTVTASGGYFEPELKPLVLPSRKGDLLGMEDSGKVLIGSDKDFKGMILIPKEQEVKEGDPVPLRLASGVMVTGEVEKIITEVPGPDKKFADTAKGVVVSFVSPTHQIIEWPKAADLDWDDIPFVIIRMIQEEAKETSQISPSESGFQWIAGPSELGEQGLLAAVGYSHAQATAPQGISASFSRIVSTDSPPSGFSAPVILSERVKTILREFHPEGQINKFNGTKSFLTEQDFTDLFKRGSVPLAYEMARHLITESNSHWPWVLDSLRSLGSDAEKDPSAAERAGAIENAIAKVLNQQKTEGLVLLRGEAQKKAKAPEFIESVFMNILLEEGIDSRAATAFFRSGYLTDDEIMDVARMLQKSGETAYETFGKKMEAWLLDKWTGEQIGQITNDVVSDHEMKGYDWRRPWENMNSDEVVRNAWQNLAREQDVLLATTGTVTTNTSLGLEKLVDDRTWQDIHKRQSTQGPDKREKFKPYAGHPRNSLGKWDVTASPEEREKIAATWVEQGQYDELMQALKGLDASQEKLKSKMLTMITGSDGARLRFYGDEAFLVYFRQCPGLVKKLIEDATKFADQSQPGMNGINKKAKAPGLEGRYERAAYMKALLALLGEKDPGEEPATLLSVLVSLVPHDYSLHALLEGMKGVSAETDLLLDRVPGSLLPTFKAVVSREILRRAKIMGVCAAQELDGHYAQGEYHPGNNYEPLGTVLLRNRVERVAKEPLPEESDGEQIKSMLPPSKTLSPKIAEEVRARTEEALGFLNGDPKNRPSYDPAKAASPRNWYSWLPLILAGLSFLGGVFYVAVVFLRNRLIKRFVFSGNAFKASNTLGSSSAVYSVALPAVQRGRWGKFISRYVGPRFDGTWFGKFRAQQRARYYEDDYQPIGDAMAQWAIMLEKSEKLTRAEWKEIRQIATALALMEKSRDKLSLTDETLERFGGNDRMHNRGMIQLMNELCFLTRERMVREGVAVDHREDYNFFRIFSARLRSLDKILFKLRNIKETLADNRVVAQGTGAKIIDGYSLLKGLLEDIGWNIARFCLGLNWTAKRWMKKAIHEVTEYEVLDQNLQAFFPPGKRTEPRQDSLTNLAKKTLPRLQLATESESTPQDFSYERRSRKIGTRMLLVCSVVISLVLLFQVGMLGWTVGIFDQHFLYMFGLWAAGSFSSITSLSWHLVSNTMGNNDFHGMEIEIREKKLEEAFQLLSEKAPAKAPAPVGDRAPAKIRTPSPVTVSMEMVRARLSGPEHAGVAAVAVFVNEGDEEPARAAIVKSLQLTYGFSKVPVVVIGVPGHKNGNGLPSLSMMDEERVETELVRRIPGWSKGTEGVLLLQAFGGKRDIVSLMTGSVFFTPTGEIDDVGRQIPTGAVTAAWGSLLLERLSGKKMRLYAPTDTFVLNALPSQLPGDITLFAATKKHEKAVGKFGVLVPGADGDVLALLEKVPDLAQLEKLYYHKAQRALVPGEKAAAFTGVVAEHISDPDKRAGFQELVRSNLSAWKVALRENPEIDFDMSLDFWVPVVMASRGDESPETLEEFAVRRAQITRDGRTLRAAEIAAREKVYQGLYAPLFDEARNLNLKIFMEWDKEAKIEDLREFPDLVKRLHRLNAEMGRGPGIAIPASRQAERRKGVVVLGLNGATPEKLPEVPGFYYVAVPLRPKADGGDRKATLHGVVAQFGDRKGANFMGIPMGRFKDETGRPIFGNRNLDDAPLFPTDLTKNVEPGRSVSDVLYDAYSGRDVVIRGGKQALRDLGLLSLNEIYAQRAQYSGLDAPLYQRSDRAPRRSEARGSVMLEAQQPVQLKTIGKKEYYVAVLPRKGQEEAFDALMSGIGTFAVKELAASGGGGEDLKKGKEARFRETLAAVKEQGNVRLHVEKESGRLIVADLGMRPLRDKKRAMIFGLGSDTQLYGLVTGGGAFFNHFPGSGGLALQMEEGSSQVIFSDLPVAKKSAIPSGNTKPLPRPALTAAVVAATLIIFLGILPLGAGAYAATLAGKASELWRRSLQTDLRALVTRAPKEYLSLPAPKADANYTLFLESALLKEQKQIEPLTRLPYKVVVVFNEAERKEYVDFVGRLGGTQEGSLEIKLGKVEEVVRLSVGRSVQEDPEGKMQNAFVGSDEKVLRHLRPLVGNLIRVDGGTLVPGEWLLDAFQSLYVFNLGKIRKDFIWTLDSALPILLERTLAIQSIAHAA